MEGGGSFRIGSSSIWRNSDAAEIFSNSFHQENDEEALKWAAIQKLPTFERLRKGLLTSLQGEATEIDVENLGLQERKDLLERLVRLAEEDNEKFLLKLKDRIDRVGIDLPTIEVRFEGLNIEAEAHVGNRSLPTFTNFMVNIVGGLLNSLHVLPSRKQHLNILKDVSGILKPSRMTLLLGPPSSGKTTLLLALAGKLDPKLKFSGKVTYNGHEMNEFVPQRTAAYVDQNDLHIGEMTVRETLAFSARVQGVGPRYDLLAELSRREKHANIMPDPDIDVYMKAIATEGQKANLITDYVLRILGLEICADTVVGNAMLRGISGGQKKRVTTGEMLVGPAKALFMDEISTGLDSSTTFQIVNSMKQFVHILKGTAVISLLQPPPETYNLFDDIILLSDSHIIYQGPREHVLEFFESIGFKCPDRKGVADFLQEVTSSKDQEQYWEHKDQPYRFVTAEEFSEAFQSFHVGRRLGDELGTEFDKSKSHPAALTTKKYGVGKRELFKACLSREYLLMKRNSFVYIFKICQICIMAMIAMTIFFRTEMHRDSVTHGGIYVGALFYGVVVIMFNGMAEISMVVSRLPVFYKQRGYLFFPPWAYALPAWILKIPLTFVEVAVWVFLTYYVIGFDPYIGRFFRQYLILVLVNQMASALFRFIAAVGRDMTVALTFGSFALAILFAMSGFVLSKDRIKKWWIWGFWISPMMYGQNAMVNNEFLGNKWKHVLPNSTDPIGVEVLKSRGYFTESYWYWIGVGALIGYTLLFNFGYILALTFLNPLGKHQTVIPDESQSDGQIGGGRKRTNVLKFIKDSFSQHSNKVRNGEIRSGMGRSPCCDESGLKKGPWTPEEDQKLVEHIQQHGHGSWRALPKLAGLNRCGKSCRLRWTNYLRPDIKRGKFSQEEEQTILHLHSILGNKWSAIATHLPGRTDNEIKNFWNTHLKKKLIQMGFDPMTHQPRTDLVSTIPYLLALANMTEIIDHQNQSSWDDQQHAAMSSLQAEAVHLAKLQCLQYLLQSSNSSININNNSYDQNAMITNMEQEQPLSLLNTISNVKKNTIMDCSQLDSTHAASFSQPLHHQSVLPHFLDPQQVSFSSQSCLNNEQSQGGTITNFATVDETSWINVPSSAPISVPPNAIGISAGDASSCTSSYGGGGGPSPVSYWSEFFFEDPIMHDLS